MIESGVSTHICCAHTGADGRLHGHTWIITAWFPAGPCALELRQRLETVCAMFDHNELVHELTTGEGLIEAIQEALPDAIEITAERPPERIYARWRTAQYQGER